MERWQPFTAPKGGDASDGRARGGGYRRDLFQFIDVIALTPQCILAVQSTSKAQLAAHVRKVVHDPAIRDNALAWLQSGGRILMMGWAKEGNRWKSTDRWIDADTLTGAKQAHDPGFDSPRVRKGAVQSEFTF